MVAGMNVFGGEEWKERTQTQFNTWYSTLLAPLNVSLGEGRTEGNQTHFKWDSTLVSWLNLFVLENWKKRTETEFNEMEVW